MCCVVVTFQGDDHSHNRKSKKKKRRSSRSHASPAQRARAASQQTNGLSNISLGPSQASSNNNASGNNRKNKSKKGGEQNGKPPRPQNSNKNKQGGSNNQQKSSQGGKNDNRRNTGANGRQRGGNNNQQKYGSNAQNAKSQPQHSTSSAKQEAVDVKFQQPNQGGGVKAAASPSASNTAVQPKPKVQLPAKPSFYEALQRSAGRPSSPAQVRTFVLFEFFLSETSHGSMKQDFLLDHRTECGSVILEVNFTQ